MPGLYFLGIKKSAIKKMRPFSFLFDWRDKRNYRRILKSLNQNVEHLQGSESVVNYRLNKRDLKLIFRKFPCSDLSVLQQVFLVECYGPIIKEMLSYFSPDDHLKILDAGANVGYSCLYFKSFFPFSELVAIEPEEKNQQQLEKNMAANNFSFKQLVKGALWHRVAFLEIARDFRDDRDAAFTVSETNKNTGIQGFGFDDILQRNGWNEVDLLKIDIEGSERFLFETNEHAENLLQKTKFLALEIHDEFNSRPVIYGHLKRNGFEYFEFGDLTMGVNTAKIKKRP
jgi:FkbM family methyltransferase